MTKRSLLGYAARLVQHSIGTSVIFMLTIGVHGSEAAGEAASLAWTHGFLLDHKLDYVLQFALSACLWALIVIGYRFALITLREMKNAKAEAQPKRVVVKARGTVMTETLIVLPVFLLLTLGLLQLTLNNTAAIFTSLAAFQSGRTVHLWFPESHSSWGRNGGVSTDNITERARVAAASVLAPVAPSGFSDGSCGTSGLFNNKMEAMMSVTLGAAGSFGAAGVSAVRAVAMGKSLSTRDNLTAARGFDEDNFAIRGPVKLLIAYCNTEAEFQNNDGKHRVTVTFDHKQTMPLVGHIFGQQIKPTGRYHSIVRTFEIPQQIYPNPSHPRSFFSLINFNPFSGIQ